MLRDYLVRIDHALRKPGLVCDILTSCEERTGIGRTIIATVTASLFLLYLLLGHGTAVLVLLIGFLYPAYQSIKAIESPSKDDDTQWLCYWVVFAFLQMVEACTFSLVYYIPIYTTIKLLQKQTALPSVVSISEFGPENVFVSSEPRFKSWAGIRVILKLTNAVRNRIP
ncbi:unnamed protein product [Dicrocoelium dendriticum]|nr:unnamed protein product [Dicrocoelium dendriticum]